MIQLFGGIPFQDHPETIIERFIMLLRKLFVLSTGLVVVAMSSNSADAGLCGRKKNTYRVCCQPVASQNLCCTDPCGTGTVVPPQSYVPPQDGMTFLDDAPRVKSAPSYAPQPSVAPRFRGRR